MMTTSKEPGILLTCGRMHITGCRQSIIVHFGDELHSNKAFKAALAKKGWTTIEHPMGVVSVAVCAQCVGDMLGQARD